MNQVIGIEKLNEFNLLTKDVEKVRHQSKKFG